MNTAQSTHEQQTYVIILTWNGKDDTIACVSNVLESGFNGTVIVVDNNSSDGTYDALGDWAKSNGICLTTIMEPTDGNYPLIDSTSKIVFLQNRGNYGFAGGNNRALSLAFAQPDCNYAWILNNDARITKETLPALLAKIEMDTRTGFCGSVIRYYESPDVLQCYGGLRVHGSLGIRRLYFKGRSFRDISSADDTKVDALMAASLLVKRKMVEEVGLLPEHYFMYAEEVDWQFRARNHKWGIAIAPNSHIFHKGANSLRSKRELYYYYLNRSSVLFTREYFGSKLYIAIFSLAAICIAKNLFSWRNIFAGFKGLRDGVCYRA